MSDEEHKLVANLRALVDASEREIAKLTASNDRYAGCVNWRPVEASAPAAPPALTLEDVAKKLRYGIVRHDVGEHDMCVCSFCGQEGHNDQPGHPYAIKHQMHCPANLYDHKAAPPTDAIDEAVRVVVGHFCECEEPYFGAQLVGILKCERCKKCFDRDVREAILPILRRTK